MFTSNKNAWRVIPGSELFYASLYLLKFTAGSANMVMNYVAWATAPVALAKTGFALLQVMSVNYQFSMFILFILFSQFSHNLLSMYNI